MMQTMKAAVTPMDNKIEADELLKQAIKMASSAMVERDGWPPVLFAAGTHSGQHVVMHADMYAAGAASPDPKERNAAWHLAKEAVKSIDAHAACSTMEAWMSVFPKDDDTIRKSLPAIQDEWPEWAIKKYRREALVFTLETATTINIYHCIIERDPQGKAVIGAPERMDEDKDGNTAASGRGVGILYNPPANQSSPLN